MRKMRGGSIVSTALLAAAFAIGEARAQSTPAEPFQPGAAVDAPAPEATKSAGGHVAKLAPKARAPAKRRLAESGGAMTVVVNNKRSVGLVQLTIAPAGGEAKKVAGPLAFGRKTTARIPHAKDCLYDVRGHFADEADTEQLGVDLCKDKTVNLTDE